MDILDKQCGHDCEDYHLHTTTPPACCNKCNNLSNICDTCCCEHTDCKPKCADHHCPNFYCCGIECTSSNPPRCSTYCLGPRRKSFRPIPVDRSESCLPNYQTVYGKSYDLPVCHSFL